MPLTRALPQKLIQIKRKTKRAGTFWCCGSDRCGLGISQTTQLLESPPADTKLLWKHCCRSGIAEQTRDSHANLTTKMAKPIAGMWLNCVCCTCCHTYQQFSSIIHGFCSLSGPLSSRYAENEPPPDPTEVRDDHHGSFIPYLLHDVHLFWAQVPVYG